jgi:hypothetical protein
MRPELAQAECPEIAAVPPTLLAAIRPAPLLLGWAGLLLAVALVTFLVLDPLKYTVIGALRAGTPPRGLPSILLGQLTPVQWLLIVSLPALLFLALAIERRAAPLSWLLGEAREGTVVLTLLLVAAWFAHSYWVPGYLLAGDSGEHVARVAHFMQAARDHTLIFWDPTAYEGNPFLQFTGPLFFWLGGVAGLIAGDATIGTKAVLFLLHIAAGLGFYGLMRALGRTPGAAFIAALAYTGAFAHIHTLLYRGEFPQALVLAFLPLLFWSAERLMAAPRIGGGAWLGLSATLAAFLYAHQTTALYAGLYLTLFVLMRGGLRGAFAALATAVIAALVLALPAYLPIMVEQRGVVMGSGLWWPHLAWPGLAYFDDLLIWRDFATSHGAVSAAYVGISTVLLALVAIFGSGAQRPRSFWFTLIALPLSVVVKGSFVRDIMVTLFLLAWLASFGAEHLLARWRWRHAPALIVLLLLLDLGPTAIQPQARTDKAYLDAAGAYLEGEAPSQRVASMFVEDGGLVPDIGPSATPIFFHAVPGLHGPHNSGATIAHNYLGAIGARAASDLNRDGRLSPGSETLLRWLDVHRIIGVGRLAMGLPNRVADATVEGPLGRTLVLRDAAPVRAAGRLVERDPDPGLDRPMIWLEDVEARSDQVQALDRFLDKVLEVGDAIPVRGPVSGGLAAGGPPPRVSIIDYKLAWNRTHLLLDSDAAGFIQLAHAWYPWLSVRVNGTSATPLQGSFDLLVLPIAAGRSDIEVSLGLTPVRKACMAVALAAMVAVVLLGWRRRRGRRPQ